MLLIKFINLFLDKAKIDVDPPASEARKGDSKFNWKEKSAYPLIWCQRICLSVCLSVCDKLWPQLFHLYLIEYLHFPTTSPDSNGLNVSYHEIVFYLDGGDQYSVE